MCNDVVVHACDEADMTSPVGLLCQTLHILLRLYLFT
jgi:hypothetical protein